MGKHFDTLIEILYAARKGKTGSLENDMLVPGRNIVGVADYLEKLVQRAALFEFPFSSHSISEVLQQDANLSNYINDYFRLSEKNNCRLITPFKLTAIEDLETVVFLDKVLGPDGRETGRYVVTSCGNDAKKAKDFSQLSHLMIANVLIDGRMTKQRTLPVVVNPVHYSAYMHQNEVDALSLDACTSGTLDSAKDVAQATTSFISELVYIMDPSNFVIKKENKISLIEDERARSKKGKQNGNGLRKTVARPHYMFLTARELKDFILENSKESNPAHPVSGHWRELLSERFRNMQGYKIFIRQYFTGEGVFEGREGWKYTVLIKTSPTRIEPYHTSKAKGKYMGPKAPAVPV